MMLSVPFVRGTVKVFLRNLLASDGQEGGAGARAVQDASRSFGMGAGRGRLELTEETDVVFVEEADVADVIADHRDALNAETEGPPGPLPGIIADLL